MARALSLNLRERMPPAVAEGASYRRAADRFGFAKASVSRWHASFRVEGEIAAKPLGNDRHSHRIEAQAAAVLQVYTTRPQIDLHEVRYALKENGDTASLSGLSRSFRYQGIEREKRICTPPSKDVRT